MTFIIFLFQKRIPIPLPSIQLVVDHLIHENIDIRKVRFHLTFIYNYTTLVLDR